MSNTDTETPTPNGVNVAALLGARQALTDAPEAAMFTWRASCEWVNGTHSRTTIDTFAGLGDEHRHRQPMTVDGDHPELFASEDNGPTPPELALASLAACLMAGVATVAANRGVILRSVRADLEGGADLQGVLGIDPDVRNGFEAITVTFTLDAENASKADLEAIVAQSQKRSAVFDMLTNPTPVTVRVA